MPVLATLSSHLSSILHTVIFSFPTPENGTVANMTSEQLDEELGKNVLFSGMAKMVQQPSEHRALASGIGPLTFVGSGYGVMLVLMLICRALLLNRIHHIVRRPRVPAPPYPHPPINSMFWKTRRTAMRLLTSPDTPRLLRLPGILSLARALSLFTILLLQVANLWPTSLPWIFKGPIERGVEALGAWAGGMQMETVCWQVFLSVCAGLACSGLADGLDQRRRGVGNSGFNLFGYAFLLHLYSSPMTHQHPPPTSTYGRPDIHPVFQLWLGLLELTWLQSIELFESTRGRQLAPTTVCGSLGLIHFVYVLGTSPLKFPSFTFMTHLLALLLSIIIIFTVSLTAFTNLFTLGYLPTPILRNLLPHEGVMPRAEDDFGVALLKLGTACMWSSQYGGMRNELVHVSLKPGPWVALSSGDSVVTVPMSERGGFGTEITQIDVAKQDESRRHDEYHREMRAFWKATWVVIVNLATSLLYATPGGKKAARFVVKTYHGRWWYGPRQWRIWRRTAWAWRDPNARQRMERLMEGQRRAAALRGPLTVRQRLQSVEPDSVGSSTALSLRSRQGSVIPYDRYLRGEVEMEDDDDDWQDELDVDIEEMDDEDGYASSDTESGSGSENGGDQGPSLSDFLPTGSNDTVDLQPVLLAHLTSSSSSPLTRRRYNALLNPPTSPSPSPAAGSRHMTTSYNTMTTMEQVAEDRRMVAASIQRPDAGDSWDEERRKACVICTVEPRDTILWPCRCLALCNDCRESLAARVEQKEHLCPCCRRKVDGFSRIFVP